MKGRIAFIPAAHKIDFHAAFRTPWSAESGNR